MCEECEEFPPQYVAYFNKTGGKVWRPARKTAGATWAIDIRPTEPATPGAAGSTRGFNCDDPASAVHASTGGKVS